jgi:hypothetical protein
VTERQKKEKDDKKKKKMQRKQTRLDQGRWRQGLEEEEDKE